MKQVKLNFHFFEYSVATVKRRSPCSYREAKITICPIDKIFKKRCTSTTFRASLSRKRVNDFPPNSSLEFQSILQYVYETMSSPFLVFMFSSPDLNVLIVHSVCPAIVRRRRQTLQLFSPNFQSELHARTVAQKQLQYISKGTRADHRRPKQQ